MKRRIPTFDIASALKTPRGFARPFMIVTLVDERIVRVQHLSNTLPAGR